MASTITPNNEGLITTEEQIDQLKENKDALEGKIKFLQETCRRAGAKIKELETRLDEAEKWKHDEVEKFRARLRDSAPYEKRLDD